MDHIISDTVSEIDKNKQLFSAYIAKPEKVDFYQNAMQKLSIGDKLSIGWAWSWWAFFFCWAYLLYRKAYIPALVSFAIGMVAYFIPFGGLIYMILSGGFSVYYVLERFNDYKSKAANLDDAQALDVMKRFGGFHTWVVWLMAIVMAFMTIAVFILIAEFGFYAAMLMIAGEG